MDKINIDRSRYPRVSQIIDRANLNELRSIPPEVLLNAQLRGTEIHKYCNMYVNNLWIDDVKPEYEPYLQAFKEWASQDVKELLHSSKRLYDDSEHFTGEFDMVCKLKNGKNYLIDIKTSALPSKSWPLQLAAYYHLCTINDIKLDDVMILHLKATNREKFESDEQGCKTLISPAQVKFVTVEYENLHVYWDLFESALHCYNYFNKQEDNNVFAK